MPGTARRRHAGRGRAAALRQPHAEHGRRAGRGGAGALGRLGAHRVPVGRHHLRGRQHARRQHHPAWLRAARCGSGSCFTHVCPPSAAERVPCNGVQCSAYGTPVQQVWPWRTWRFCQILLHVLMRQTANIVVLRCRPRLAVALGKPALSRSQARTAAACREPERRAGGALGATRAQHGEQPADGHAAARVRQQPAQPAGARPVRQPAPGAAPVLASSPYNTLRQHTAR